MYQYIYSGKTDIGCKRSNNEDQYVVNPEYNFCAAADGMGGAAAGEIASLIFTDTASEILVDNFNRSENEILFRVKKVFSNANEKIREHIKKNPDHEGMGCTAELLTFYNNSFISGHVGDSRTYLLRRGELKQITRDHTLVQQQVDAGIIPASNIKTHPLRNIILRAIGHQKDLQLDVTRGKIFPDDLFLLCSDGLTDMLNTNRIEEIIRSDTDIDIKATELIEQSKKAGGDDNITVVLVSVA
ncbi:MAG: Stp1/IreP family PP2C-type Ser/Thr phosphatase [Desulfobacteraceae bacterium]|jgi:protein phosphatase